MGKLGTTPEEEHKRRDKDAAELIEDEYKYVRDEDLDLNVVETLIMGKSKAEAERFIHLQKREIYQSLSEKRRQQLRDRYLAVEAGARFEFDDEMRTELQTAVKLQMDKYTAQDRQEAARAFDEMDRIAEMQRQRREEDAKKLKASTKQAQKDKDFVRDQLNARRTPQSKKACCVLL